MTITQALPRDPAFPQLYAALDPMVLKDQIRTLPGFEGSRIDHCQVEHVRYKPGSSCLVVYRVQVRGKHDEMAERLMIGKMVAGEDHQETRGFLPELHMSVRHFPDDRLLRGLDRFWEPGKLRRLLHQTVPGFQDEAWRISKRQLEIELVSYKPERRCLVRCSCKTSHRVTGEQAKRIVFARMYADDSGPVVYRAMQTLWELQREQSWPFRLAQPLGYDPGSRILFQSREKGQPLTSLLAKPEGLMAVRRVARALAHVHGTALHIPRAVDPLGELQTFERLARAAGRVHAPAKQLALLTRRLRDLAAWVRGAPQVLIHGDFTPEQILLNGKAMSLLDFDWVALGDPLIDVASFSGSLWQLQVDGVITPAVAAMLDRAFCRRYAKAHPVEHFTRRLRWHRAAFLMKRSLETIWLLKAGWAERMERYSQLAAQMLDGHDQS